MKKRRTARLESKRRNTRHRGGEPLARETGQSRSFETSTFSIPPAILAARRRTEEIRNSKNHGKITSP